MCHRMSYANLIATLEGAWGRPRGLGVAPAPTWATAAALGPRGRKAGEGRGGIGVGTHTTTRQSVTKPQHTTQKPHIFNKSSSQSGLNHAPKDYTKPQKTRQGSETLHKTQKY